jgi:protein-L-isoaspartate(D-aspartate) O-methyltransferase
MSRTLNVFPKWPNLGSRTDRQIQPDTDTLRARQKMVRQQLQVPDRGITDHRVLAAMEKVPRHEFTPEKVRAEAYDDTALPIGYGQTISQPFIVAFMTEHLQPQSNDRVLEIGTGSGYQTAVLAGLVREICTIEIIESLATRARADLNRLGYKNVRTQYGDGHAGWPEPELFDSIIVTCAPVHVPPPLIAQLKEGGRMLIPLGPKHHQQINILQKFNGQLNRQATLPVRFVPLTRSKTPSN